MFHTLFSAHCFPVVLIFVSAEQTYLVKVTIRCPPRPGKLVGTAIQHKDIENLVRHDCTSGWCPKPISSTGENRLGRLLRWLESPATQERRVHRRQHWW